MSSSGTRKREEMLDADGNAIVDGVLTPTPDSPADSEWRSRAGPLDVNSGNGGPWKQEDCSGRWFRSANSISVFLSTRKFGCVIIIVFSSCSLLLFVWVFFWEEKRLKNNSFFTLRCFKHSKNRTTTGGHVRQVHVENREFLGDFQTRASFQVLRSRRVQVVHSRVPARLRRAQSFVVVLVRGRLR